MRKRKRKNEIHIRFSKWCENEKRKLKFISVFQRDAKTKYEVQNRFSKLVENEKQKAKFKSVFQCHAKTKNGNGTWIPFSHAIEKRLALRYTHYLGCVRLGNLDLDFEIRISDLQSNAKSENGFQRWDWIFIFTVRLENPKKDLKNCPWEQRSCTRTHT